MAALRVEAIELTPVRGRNEHLADPQPWQGCPDGTNAVAAHVRDVHDAVRAERDSPRIDARGERRPPVSCCPRNTISYESPNGPVWRGDSDARVVRNIDHSPGIEADPPGEMQRRQRRGAPVAGEPVSPVPGHRRDDPLRGNPADTAVEQVSNVDIALSGNRDPGGGVQHRLDGEPAVAAVAGHAGSSNRCDDPIRPDPPNPVVLRVTDVQTPVGAKRETVRRVERCLHGRSAITRVPKLSRTRYRRNDAVETDAADLARVPLGDVQRPVRAERQSERKIDCCLDRQPTVGTGGVLAGSCDCADDAVRPHLAHPRTERVPDVEAAVGSSEDRKGVM